MSDAAKGSLVSIAGCGKAVWDMGWPAEIGLLAENVRKHGYVKQPVFKEYRRSYELTIDRKPIL